MKKYIFAVITATAILSLGLSYPLSDIYTKKVTCGTTATEVSAGVKSMTLINTNAGAVFFGGKDVAIDGASEGGSFCATGCDFGPVVPIDSKRAFCVASADTEIKVVFGY